MKDCNCKKPLTVEHVLNTDIDEMVTPVDYFLGVRTIEDPQTGVVKGTPVRIPGNKVIPTGSNANVIAMTTNNDALNIPEGQVRAGYIDVQPGGNIMRYADASHPAMFIMLGAYTNGKMLIQTTGFLAIASGHQYITGAQYYVSDNGAPTTDSTSGQKLFIPLDDYTLSINLNN